MLRRRFDYPDLDDLDSPLVSPTPLASGIPGSALAERIFNDPESWEDNEDDDYDFPEDVSTDQLNWLAEELEKFKQSTPAAQPTSEKAASLISTPVEPVHQNLRHSGLKGIGKRGSVRPISLTALFDHSKEDFSSDIQQQLSKILDSGKIPHHIRPHSPSLTPPSTSGTASSIDSPLHVHTASAIRINNGETSPSPINIYSASATLSFLEWYGIYPDSPRLDFAGLPPKSLRMKIPLLQVPSPRQPMRPSPLISSSATATFPLPPTQRISPVDPPGLEPPSKVAEVQVVAQPVRSRPPPPVPVPELPTAPTAPAINDSPDQLSAQEQPTILGRSESDSSERGRPLRTAPPAYMKSPLPQPFVARSISDVTNHSTCSPKRPPPRVNGGSQDLTPIRRLPSIPPESARPRSATPPQSRREVVERGSSRRATPPPLPAPPPPSASSNASAGLVAPQQMRPLSARSPLGGPAGPRVRSRGREARGFAGIPSANRLPGLRL